MPVPGYDPDDVEELVETTINDHFDQDEIAERLSEEDARRLQQGERAVDLLSEDQVDEMLQQRVYS